MFQGISSKELQIVIDAMEQRNFSAGETVISQGDKGNHLFVVDEGELDCFKTYSHAEGDQFIRKYSEGEVFGELALLYNAPRAASIIAKTKCVLFALDRETFNHIVRDSTMKKKETYEEFLRGVPILKDVETGRISQLADVILEKVYPSKSFLIKQGEVGNDFYIVMEGKAEAFQRNTC